MQTEAQSTYTLPAIQHAQDRLGIPVTSTAVCTARTMLDLLGLPA